MTCTDWVSLKIQSGRISPSIERTQQLTFADTQIETAIRQKIVERKKRSEGILLGRKGGRERQRMSR